MAQGRSRSVEALPLPYAVARTLARSRDTRETLVRVLELIVDGQSWDVGMVWLAESGRLRYWAEHVLPGAQVHAERMQAVLESSSRWEQEAGTGELPRNGHRVCWCHPSTSQSPSVRGCVGSRHEEGPQTTVIVRFMCGATMYGAIELFSHESRPHNDDQQHCLDLIGSDLASFLSARRFEIRVRSRNARLVEAQRIARLAYWEYHPASGRLRSAGEMSQVLGLPRGALPSSLEEYLEYVPGTERAGFHAAFARVSDPCVRSAEFEHRLFDPDSGQERVILLRALADFDTNERMVRISGTVQDVTPYRQLEDHLRLAATAIEHAGDAIVIFDARGNILFTNAAFTHITGYTEQEAYGKKLDTLLIQPEGRYGAPFYRRVYARLRASGRWKGEVWARASNGRSFVMQLSLSEIREAGGRVTHHVGVFADVSRQIRYKERLEQMALHDSLTGLPNRALFFDRGAQALAQAERSGTSLGLIFIDLDLFKAVNDRYGHAVGDEVLMEAGVRMRNVMRSCDTVARLGGDEFVVLLTGIHGEHDCVTAAERLVDSLTRPYDVGDAIQVRLGASLGLALFPIHGRDIHTLLQRADQALYSIKRDDLRRYAMWLPEPTV